MDAMRKQLDVLMGANRNGDVTEVNRKYYDRDVCRLYLSGLCPHDLFQLTKMDMSPCPKVHSLQLRKEYLFFLSLELYFSVFVALTHSLDIKKRRQKVLEDAIDKAQGTHLVALDRHAPFKTQVECDRKIGRALKRLQEENAKAAIAISVTQVAQSPEIQEADLHVEEMRTKRADLQAVLLLEAFNKDRAALPTPAQQPSAALPPPNPRTQEMINEKLKKAEEFGELGMVDEAQKALEEAEALKKTDQKLRLCDICGAFLSIYDSDRRLADHFGGKLHLGYMLIRDKLAELQEEKNKVHKEWVEERRSKERSRERESSKERDRGDSRDRGRDIDRRNRDRDRHHEHDRNYNQSRGYDSRSRRSSRSRSRERPRDYDRRR
uniref:Uncharacterized protein n=1 Tax=Brassica oleracea var. oleracea TaxID=109376 RepID=A0A0D3B1N2_BRAOL